MKKKTLKGMTLVEVLIATAILGIMTLFLAKNAYVIEDYNRATTNLNQKVAVEAPLAELQKISKIPKCDEDGNLLDESGNPLAPDKPPVYVDHTLDDSITVSVSDNKGHVVDINGKAYSTEDAYVSDDGVAGSGLNLKFIVLE